MTEDIIVAVKIIVCVAQMDVRIFIIQGTVIRLVQLSVISSIIALHKGFLRFFHCQEQSPGLAVDRYPGITAERRGHSHILHHVIGNPGFHIAVVLKRRIQGKFIQTIITSVGIMVKLHLQTVAVQTILFGQPPGIIALYPQPHVGKTLAVNDNGTGLIFFLCSRIQKSLPVLQHQIHGMHPGRIKQPRFISRRHIGGGQSQLRAVHKQKGHGNCRRHDQNTDLIDIFVF